MSTINKSLLLVPSVWCKTEQLTTTLECPACLGRGAVRSDAISEHIDVDCPHCGGSGKVTARIKIEWDFKSPVGTK